METIPFATNNPIFRRVEEVGRMANLSRDEMFEYEQQLKAYRDRYSQYSSAINKGLTEGFTKGHAVGVAEGREEGAAEKQLAIARNMKQAQMSVAVIAKMTGLTEEQIESL